MLPVELGLRNVTHVALMIQWKGGDGNMTWTDTIPICAEKTQCSLLNELILVLVIAVLPGQTPTPRTQLRTAERKQSSHRLSCLIFEESCDLVN